MTSVHGVIALFGSPNRSPLANGIVVDGLILTSAASVEGFDRIYAPDGSRWIMFDIVASDPHTDIAVLEQLGPAVSFSPVVTALEGLATNPGQAVEILHSHTSSTSTEAETRHPDPETSSANVGEVVATDERATTNDGYQILGTLLTTCRNSELVVGGALVNARGQAVGIVVDSSGDLAAALPLQTAIQIGHSLMSDGWRGGAWLGVSGETADGGFRLHDLDPLGPAALAGLANDDLITKINDQPLQDFAELLHMLRLLGENDLIRVELVRTHPTTGELVTRTIEIALRAKVAS